MRLLGRTIARTREALAGLEPGAVLCVRTDDP
jgi:TusA-related sulfurtransferase